MQIADVAFIAECIKDAESAPGQGTGLSKILNRIAF
jgi:hypothetical protein